MRTLYRASLVRTLSHPGEGEWILVDGRHVERVGAGAPPGSDRVVELPGTTIVPGFVDSHVHLTGTGTHHRHPELREVDDAAGLIAVLSQTAAAGEGPLLVHGWDETRWWDPTLPSIDDLDAVTDRPLAAARADGHLTLVNRLALDAAGLLRDEAEGVERDADGRPTGRVTREANIRVRVWVESHLHDNEIEELQLEAASIAVAHGVTSVHEMSLPELRGARDLQILLAHRHRLPVDVVPYVATTDVAMVIDLGLATIGGDLLIDGSVGARTAWLSEPYADASGCGVGYREDDELAAFFHEAHVAGLQVAVHAIGDAAIDQVLRVWERVYGGLDSRGRRHFRARRHRIEHFELVDPSAIERAAALGLAVSVQPSFDAEWGGAGGLYEIGLGRGRASRMNPFRSLLHRGLELGAGSDSPVTTIDPLAGVWAFELHHDPIQRLTREQAIRAFTVGSARLAHQEGKKGSLEPGAHADFAAYEADPFTHEAFDGVAPVLTVSLGREVFAR